MIGKVESFVFLAAFLSGMQQCSAAPSLTLVTESRPPRQMLENGNVVGTATAKVKSLMDSGGLSYSLDLYPFARAFHMAKTQPNVCIFSIARTQERENQFIWITPALTQIHRVFLARDDSNIRLNSLDDAKKYSVGTYNGDAMDKYFKDLNWNVDTAPYDVSNLYKLISKRIDLWVDDEQVAQYLIETNNDKTPIHSVYDIQTLDIFLACNPKTDTETIANLMRNARSAWATSESTRRNGFRNK